MIKVNIVNPNSSLEYIPFYYYQYRDRLETSINIELGQIEGVIEMVLSKQNGVLIVNEYKIMSKDIVSSLHIAICLDKFQTNFNYYMIDQPDEKLIYELEKLSYKEEFINYLIEFRLDNQGIKSYNLTIEEDNILKINLPNRKIKNSGKSHRQINDIIIKTLKEIYLITDLLVTSGVLKVREEDLSHTTGNSRIELVHKFDTKRFIFKSYDLKEEPLTTALIKYSNKRLMVI